MPDSDVDRDLVVDLDAVDESVLDTVRVADPDLETLIVVDMVRDAETVTEDDKEGDGVIVVDVVMESVFVTDDDLVFVEESL